MSVLIPAELNFGSIERQIEEGVLRASREVLERAIIAAIPSIRHQLRVIIDKAITDSPEYKELLAGDLGKALGIPSPTSAMANVIRAVGLSLNVTYKRVHIYGKQLRGGLIIEILKSDFSDVLNAAGSSYDTLNGQNVPWLEWLLTAGDRVVVANYNLVFKPSQSRTGTYIMGRTRRGGWRVPPQFSGTPKNNFLTRALATKIDDISKLIEIEVSRRIF